MRRRLGRHERREVALHEARHMVLALMTGVPAQYAEIDIETDQSGRAALGQVVIDLEALKDQMTDDGLDQGRHAVVRYISVLIVGYAGAGPWMPDLPDGRAVAK